MTVPYIQIIPASDFNSGHVLHHYNYNLNGQS